jgi:DNA-binding Lrp family transcriptional regulator
MTEITQPSAADWAVIELLRQNARLSVTELASRLGLARGTVQARLQRLEQSGVIAGYGLRLHPALSAQRIGAQSLLRVDARLMPQVLAAASRIQGVQAIHSVAGEFDLLAVLSCDSAQALDADLDALAAITGVQRTQTSVLLAAKFNRH